MEHEHYVKDRLTALTEEEVNAIMSDEWKLFSIRCKDKDISYMLETGKASMLLDSNGKTVRVAEPNEHIKVLKQIYLYNEIPDKRADGSEGVAHVANEEIVEQNRLKESLSQVQNRMSELKKQIEELESNYEKLYDNELDLKDRISGNRIPFTGMKDVPCGTILATNYFNCSNETDYAIFFGYYEKIDKYVFGTASMWSGCVDITMVDSDEFENMYKETGKSFNYVKDVDSVDLRLGFLHNYMQAWPDGVEKTFELKYAYKYWDGNGLEFHYKLFKHVWLVDIVRAICENNQFDNDKHKLDIFEVALRDKHDVEVFRHNYNNWSREYNNLEEGITPSLGDLFFENPTCG